jgi:ankyrin repeat protein
MDGSLAAMSTGKNGKIICTHVKGARPSYQFTKGASSGKVYYEVRVDTLDDSDELQIGWCLSVTKGFSSRFGVGQDDNSWSYWSGGLFLGCDDDFGEEEEGEEEEEKGGNIEGEGEIFEDGAGGERHKEGGKDDDDDNDDDINSNYDRDDDDGEDGVIVGDDEEEGTAVETKSSKNGSEHGDAGGDEDADQKEEGAVAYGKGSVIGVLAEFLDETEDDKNGRKCKVVRLSFAKDGRTPVVAIERALVPDGQSLCPAISYGQKLTLAFFPSGLQHLPDGFDALYRERPAKVKLVDDIPDKTLLYSAAERGDEKQLRQILEGMNKNVSSMTNEVWFQGRTPLLAAAKNGKLEVCRLLIDLGADVQIQSNDGATPLMAAAEGGHVDVCKLLLDNCDKSFINQSDRGFTALVLASRSGQREVVGFLLSCGANVSATALLYACEGGHVEIAKLLIEAEADVNAQNEDQETALILACKISTGKAVGLKLALEIVT